jgi:amino acid transporter
MTDYDGTTHMSEETHDAAIRGPQAIRHAVAISSILGLALTITLCFCISDLDTILASPTGLPAAQIFLNAGGVTGGTFMWFFVILVQFFTGCSAMLADTRMAYAFARDGALPFSAFFSRVNHKTRTPLHAVWFIVVFSSLLNLIGIGSTATIVGVFNITAPALDLSYAAVIFARNLYSSQIPFVPGPYRLGPWRKPLNYITIVWVTFISVVLMFPTARPVTPENMNYAIVVAGVIATSALGWWFAGARKTYVGPRTRDLVGEGGEVEGSNSEDGGYEEVEEEYYEDLIEY